MIIVMGDLHLRDDKDFFKLICLNFLEWFKNWDLNRPGNSLILAGDLVETALLSGTVADYLDKLAMYSKFDNVYICVGNHDVRKVNDSNQLAYEFLKNRENFHIYEEASNVTIEGKKVLMLPYFKGTNFDGKTMGEFYGNLWQDKRFNGHYDLVVGHFNDDSIMFGGELDIVRNLDKLDADRILLGHIHTRYIKPEMYIGSVFANKKGENDSLRAVQILDENGWREEPLPVFNEFVSVTYPEKLPKPKCQVPIYTVLNCTSESIARSKYGNIFIRKVTPNLVDSTNKRRVSIDKGFDSIRSIDLNEELENFFKSQSVPFDPIIEEECRNLIRNRQVS